MISTAEIEAIDAFHRQRATIGSARLGRAIDRLLNPPKRPARPKRVRARRRPSVEPFAKADALAAEISLADLVGPSRKANLCSIRFRIWCHARRAGCSVRSIARFFNRDRATVLHGIRRHEGRELSA